MKYVVHYCIASAVYLFILTVTYLNQKKIPSVRTKIYTYMLSACFIALLGDCLAGLLSGNAYFPLWMNFAINILYLFFTQSAPAAFFIYVLILTGNYSKMSRDAKGAVFIPFLITAIALFMSPFTEYGVFFFDNFVYQSGKLHFILYAAAGLYLLASIITLTAARRNIRKRKLYVTYGFIGTVLLVMIIQSLAPIYLVNTSAYAIALTIMYFALEAPSQHIDPVTNTFNRSSFNIMTSDLFEENEPFNVMVFTIETIAPLESTSGVTVTDVIRAKVATLFSLYFQSCSVARLEENSFAVLDASGKYTYDDALRIYNTLPKSIAIGELSVSLENNPMVYLKGSDFKNNDELFASIEYILHDYGNLMRKTVFIDKGEIEKIHEKALYLEAINRAIANDSIEVYYQGICTVDGTTKALESLARIVDDKLGMLMPEKFIRLSEQNGSIVVLGRQIFAKVCGFIASHAFPTSVEFVTINVSTLQLLEENLAESFKEIASKYNVTPSKIHLEITESQSLANLSVVKENIAKLEEAGFSFALDDFGSGYSNFSYLVNMNFSYIKIDKTILWDAINKNNPKVIKGITDLCKNLNCGIIVEGVETHEQLEMLKKLNVDLFQGFLFAKPLRSDELAIF